MECTRLPFDCMDQQVLVGVEQDAVEGVDVTAALTEPSEVLNPGIPNCAAGTPAAVVMSFVGLLGLWFIRRRR